MDGSFSSSPVAGDAHRGVANSTRTTRSPTARAALIAPPNPPPVRVPWRASISDQSAVSLPTEAPTSRSIGKSAPSPAEKPMGTGRIAGAARSVGCAVAATISASTTAEERLTHITYATYGLCILLPLSTHRPAHVVRRVREEHFALDGIALTSVRHLVTVTPSRNRMRRVLAANSSRDAGTRGGGGSCMWDRPRAVSVVSGSSEGLTELTAFDRALMDAGIANLNFLRVSSILPADVTIVTSAGKMLLTRRKFRLAIPASMSARSNAVSSVRPSLLPLTTETARGRSHMQEPPPPLVPASRDEVAANTRRIRFLDGATVTRWRTDVKAIPSSAKCSSRTRRTT